MNEPRRLIESDNDDFERDLLRSAHLDQGSERALRRTLVSIGVGLAVTPAAIASAVPATVTLGSKLGTVVLAKWLFTGVALGVVTASGVGLSERVLERAPSATTRPPAKSLAAPPSVGAQSPSFSREGPREPAEPVPDAVSDPLPPTPAPAARRAGNALAPVTATPSAPVVAAEPASPPATPHDAPLGGEVERLAKETTLLDTARGALLRGDAGRALQTLAEYERTFARGMLVPEARVLRVRALLASDRRRAAEELAQRIIEGAPNSEHAGTVRALLGRPSNR